jgi:hypothetical protein
MVKKIFFFSLVLLTSCSVSNFTIKKLPISSNVLKLNGYYFYSNSSVYANGVGVCFLYSNGVLYELNSNYESLDQALKYYKIKDNNVTSKNYPIERSYWGLYRTLGDSIILEQHDVGQGFPLFKFTGRILNDTTFYINTSKKENEKTKTFENIVYHFKKFEPKPDSTNKFVN